MENNVLFVSFVSQVMVPLITNESNHWRWPAVVSQDVVQHTGSLKGDVFVLSGQVKGRTLLPLPPQAERAAQATDRPEHE